MEYDSATVLSPLFYGEKKKIKDQKVLNLYKSNKNISSISYFPGSQFQICTYFFALPISSDVSELEMFLQASAN